MIDWQPIETAPKDGTTVLLWVPNARLSPVFAGEWRGAWRVGLFTVCNPTHWAPLNPPEGA